MERLGRWADRMVVAYCSAQGKLSSRGEIVKNGEMDRRQLLKAGVGGVGILGLAACVPQVPGLDPAPVDWSCGVASGLHASDAAVLWTRFDPAASSPTDVSWEVASDPGFANIVRSGSVQSHPATDGTVKVLADGLAPGTSHWYRFLVGSRVSPVGHTKTLPASASSPAGIRLAVASCQNFAAGFYTAWRSIAGQPLDGVLFLGDYIYESGGSVNVLLGDVRDDPSAEALNLDTYRAKYRMYRSDPDLRAAHAAHGFAPVWDDHEFHDNHHSGSLAEDPVRAAAAYQAFFEYQPIWPIDSDRIYRSLRFGDLLDVSMLDTRQYRDPNPENDLFQATNAGPASIVHDEGRTFLGAAQKAWLLDQLGTAQADGVTWKLLGQQTMMAPLRAIDLDEPNFQPVPEHAGVYFNLDQWDGYTHERDLITAFLHDESITNMGVLTGDIHSFWQASIHTDMEDWSSPAVAQEFVCGSISSTALGFSPDLADSFSSLTKGFSPAFRWVDWKRRGYGLVACTPDDMHVEFHAVDASVRGAPDRQTVAFDWAEGTHDVAVTT